MTSKVEPGAIRKPPNAGKGRVKGVPNKTTKLLKDAILQAARQAGGGGDAGLVAYLAARAEDTPGPFMALLGKVLPMQVTGSDGGPIRTREEGARERIASRLAGLAARTDPDADTGGAD